MKIVFICSWKDWKMRICLLFYLMTLILLIHHSVVWKGHCHNLIWYVCNVYSKRDLYFNSSHFCICYYSRQMSIWKVFFHHLKSFLDLAMPWKGYLLWNLSLQKLSKQRRKQTSFFRGNFYIQVAFLFLLPFILNLTKPYIYWFFLFLASSFLKQHNDEAAVFQSFRDINELIQDTIELKRRQVAVESELKEMQGRYSELSVQFAEVEGERQKLEMNLKNQSLWKS